MSDDVVGKAVDEAYRQGLADGRAEMQERVEAAFSQHLCRCRAEPEQDCMDHGDDYAQHLGGIYRAALFGATDG